MKSTAKRAFAVLLTLALCVSLLSVAYAAGMENFTDKKIYTEGHFTDIGGKWFEGSVARGYSLGLIDGKGNGIFDPTGNVTLAEAIKLAACLHRIYTFGENDFVQGSPWYQVYVDYCLTKGILTSGYSDYNAAATRAQFAQIFASALPASALSAMNTVEDNAIPDVKIGDSCGAAVYKLYRAGILTGSDGKGTFNPASNIQRSEMAAIVTRMADPDLRKEVYLTASQPGGALSAEQIAAQCASAVFYIEIYDRNGSAIAGGSGVFISADGKALTNQHVVEDAYSAKIKTSNGSVYNVSGYYDAKESIDLALIQVAGSGFPYLNMDTASVAAGQTVFAIGSPLGLDNTISQGIISNPRRTIDGLDYIQVTTPTSHGSSGGALLNDRGSLIGITTASFTDGQNLNLAVPVSYYSELSVSALRSFPLGSSAADSGASLSFSTSLSMNAGSWKTINISADPGTYDGSVSIRFEVGDGSVVSAEWDEWYGWDIALYVYGEGAGTTTIEILLITDEKEVLCSKTLNVTVSGSQSSAYYPGYYHMPDLGAQLGITPRLVQDGIYYYAYVDFPDFAMDMEDYESSLFREGFEFWKEDVDSYGDPLLYYYNEYYDLYLCIGIDTVGGALCIYLMPYFGWEV